MGIPTAAAPPGTSFAAVALGTAMIGVPETATAAAAVGTRTAAGAATAAAGGSGAAPGGAGRAPAQARQPRAGLGQPGPVAAGSDSWQSFAVPHAGARFWRTGAIT